MTRKIDFSFRITCQKCGHVTSFGLSDAGEKTAPRCTGCGHPFTVSHELVLTLRRRVEEFLDNFPETEE